MSTLVHCVGFVSLGVSFDSNTLKHWLKRTSFNPLFYFIGRCAHSSRHGLFCVQVNDSPSAIFCHLIAPQVRTLAVYMYGGRLPSVQRVFLVEVVFRTFICRQVR